MTNEEAWTFAKKNAERKHEVIQFITEAYWRICWCHAFPDDICKIAQCITNSHEAVWWACTFPKYKNNVIICIDNSEDACKWAMWFPKDKDKVIQFVDEQSDIKTWIDTFPKDEEYFKNKGFCRCGKSFNAKNEARWVGVTTMLNEEAFEFAEKNPERKHEVIQYITDSYEALLWVLRWPSDTDKLIPYITNQHDATRLAERYRDFKDRMIMLITESYYAVRWVEIFPQDISTMLHIITESSDVIRLFEMNRVAYNRYRLFLIPKITTNRDAREWLRWFPNDKEYFIKKGLWV